MKCPHCGKDLDIASISNELTTECKFVNDFWCEVRESECAECGKAVVVKSYYELVHYTYEVEPAGGE